MRGERLIPVFEKGDHRIMLGTIVESKVDNPVFSLLKSDEIESYELVRDESGRIEYFEVVFKHKPGTSRTIPFNPKYN